MTEAEARGMTLCPLCGGGVWATMETHAIVENAIGQRFAAHLGCARKLSTEPV